MRISADGEKSCPSRVGPSTLYAFTIQNSRARDTIHASWTRPGDNQYPVARVSCRRVVCMNYN